MTVRDTKIKLTDAGYTVLVFVKRAYYEDGVWTSDDWGIEVKPPTSKMMAHVRRQTTHTPDRYLKYLPDEGRRSLEVRGLSLRWEKVIPVLDRLAEHSVPEVTIDQLR